MEESVESKFQSINVSHSRTRMDMSNSSSEDVTFLQDPINYYNLLLHEISYKSTDHIVLSALYIGCGELEQQLIRTIGIALNDTNRPNLKVTLILDYHRANRLENGTSSVTMLNNFIKEYNLSIGKQLSVYMYKIPHTIEYDRIMSMIGLKQHVVNEILGVYHCKFCLFDNRVLLTGANLSNEYFHNRQDRYMYINNSSSSSSSSSSSVQQYLKDFIYIIQPFCHRLDSAGSIVGPVDRDSVRLKSLLEATLPTTTSIADGAAVCHLSIQHAKINVNQELPVIKKLLDYTNTVSSGTNTSGNNSKHMKYSITLATPYPSFTASFASLLNNEINKRSKSISQLSLVVPSHKSHGFNKANGMKAYVPMMHQDAFMESLETITRPPDSSSIDTPHKTIVEALSYQRNDWTFHSKGIWMIPQSTPDHTLPCITYIGSSNFGERSWSRDFELGFFIVATEPSLKRKVADECSSLLAQTVKFITHYSNSNNNSNSNPLSAYKIRLFTRLFRTFL